MYASFPSVSVCRFRPLFFVGDSHYLTADAACCSHPKSCQTRLDKQQRLLKWGKGWGRPREGYIMRDIQIADGGVGLCNSLREGGDW